MGRILVVRGPKMSSIWYFGGPEGKSIKNPRVLIGFQGFRGPRGAMLQAACELFPESPPGVGFPLFRSSSRLCGPFRSERSRPSFCAPLARYARNSRRSPSRVGETLIFEKWVTKWGSWDGQSTAARSHELAFWGAVFRHYFCRRSLVPVSWNR